MTKAERVEARLELNVCTRTAAVKRHVFLGIALDSLDEMEIAHENSMMLIRKERDTAVLQRDALERERDALLKTIRQCPTCDGTGVMHIDTGDPLGVGVSDEECAECNGMGVSSWGQALDERDRLRADLAEADASYKGASAECAALRNELHVEKCAVETLSTNLGAALAKLGEIEKWLRNPTRQSATAINALRIFFPEGEVK